MPLSGVQDIDAASEKQKLPAIDEMIIQVPDGTCASSMCQILSQTVFS